MNPGKKNLSGFQHVAIRGDGVFVTLNLKQNKNNNG